MGLTAWVVAHCRKKQSQKKDGTWLSTLRETKEMKHVKYILIRMWCSRALQPKRENNSSKSSGLGVCLGPNESKEKMCGLVKSVFGPSKRERKIVWAFGVYSAQNGGGVGDS